MVPQPTGQRPRFLLDRTASRERDAIERLVGRLKPFHRVPTCGEKRAAIGFAMLQIAAVFERMPFPNMP